eukprot:gb/GECG01006493.1/.p1 GENE.gb/GECG01006493.1/~~gb/GECG01006493.1/.p1  ORF type:complete len:1706 (+),score=153.74 gb/GECG01006493.1/:1-5118(+)
MGRSSWLVQMYLGMQNSWRTTRWNVFGFTVLCALFVKNFVAGADGEHTLNTGDYTGATTLAAKTNWLGYYFETEVNMSVTALLGGTAVSECQPEYHVALFTATLTGENVKLHEVVANSTGPPGSDGERITELETSSCLRASQGYFIGRSLILGTSTYEQGNILTGVEDMMEEHHLRTWEPYNEHGRTTLRSENVWVSSKGGRPKDAVGTILTEESFSSSYGTAQVLGFNYTVVDNCSFTFNTTLASVTPLATATPTASTSGSVSLTPPPSPSSSPSQSASPSYSTTTSSSDSPKASFLVTARWSDSVTGSPSATASTSASATATSSALVSFTSFSATRGDVRLKSEVPSLFLTSFASQTTSDSPSASSDPSLKPPLSPTSSSTARVSKSPSSTIMSSPSSPPAEGDKRQQEYANVWPKGFNISVARGASSLEPVEKSLSISTGEGTKWSCFVSPSLRGIISFSSPKEGSGDKQVRIKFVVSSLPEGVTLGELTVRFFSSPQSQEDIVVPVQLHVHQGILVVGTSLISSEKSASMKKERRFVRLYNAGDYPVHWNSSVALDGGNTLGISPWVEGDHNGSIPGGSESALEVTLIPRNTEASGLYSACLCIHTNAWDIKVAGSREEACDLRCGSKIHIEVRLTITSVFLCNQFPTEVPLRPLERKRLRISIVNTELSTIQVLPFNFSLAISNESMSNKVPRNQSDITTEIVPLQAKETSNGSQLSSWMSFTPSSFSLARGSSRDLTLSVGYPSRMLPLKRFQESGSKEDVMKVRPGRFHLDFSVGVNVNIGSRSGPSGVMDDSVGRVIELNFVPGEATRLYSFLEISDDQSAVRNTIVGVVHLRDAFQYPNASAKYSSIGAVTDGDLPVLSVHLKTLEARTSLEPIRYTSTSRLTEGTVVTSLELSFQFISVGRASLDITLNGDSISNSPVNFTSLAAKCNLKNEVQDQAGTGCLCVAGHFRNDEDECVPCPEGTQQAIASNIGHCESCSDGSFSLVGATQCRKCPPKGVQCSRGRPSMQSGYWCQSCSAVSIDRSNREQLVNNLIEGESVAFYHCIVPEACIVNQSAFVTKCREGYHGEVCGYCDIGYLKMLDGSCAKCPEGHSNRTVTAMSAVAVIMILIALTVYSTKKSAWEKESQGKSKGESQKIVGKTRRILDIQVLNVADPRERAQLIHDYYSRNGHWESLKRLLLIFIDYLQISSVLHQMEISPFVGPLEWLNGVARASTMNPSNASPIRCATDTSAFEVAVSVMLSPFILISTLLLLHAMVELKRSKRKFRPNRWATDSMFSMIIILNLIHMAVTDVTLRSLDTHSEQIGSSSRARIDIGIETSSSKFGTLRVVSFFSLFVFVFGVPIFVGMFLRWWHSKARTPKLYKELLKFVGGFRLSGYGYLWEPLVLLRKLFLLIVAVFSSSPVNQMVLGTGILLFSYICLAYFRPFYASSLNHLEGLMIMVSALNFYLGLLLLPVGDEGEARINQSIVAPKYVTAGLQMIFVLAAASVMVLLIPGAASKISLALSRKLALVGAKWKQVSERFKSFRAHTEDNQLGIGLQPKDGTGHSKSANIHDMVASHGNPLFGKSDLRSGERSLPPIKATPVSSRNDSTLSSPRKGAAPRTVRRRKSKTRNETARSMQRLEEVSTRTGLVVRYNRPAKRFADRPSSSTQEERQVSRDSRSRTNRSGTKSQAPSPVSGTNINPLDFSSPRGYSK